MISKVLNDQVSTLMSMTLEEKAAQMQDAGPGIHTSHGRQRLHGSAGRGSRPPPRVIVTSKHFAVHSEPESLRHKLDVAAPPQDLEDTYLLAFRAAFTEAHAGSVPCAYNAVEGKAHLRQRFSSQDASPRRVEI